VPTANESSVSSRITSVPRRNVLIAGGTSTGKTTLVNALLAEVAKTTDRVVLIEDTRELQCKTPNLVALRTKDGVASLSDLVRSSLRLRPDRIPIGEVRGAEALDLLKAWGTGHPGGILRHTHAMTPGRDRRVKIGQRRGIGEPRGLPMHLDALLADEPLMCGLEPRLGNAHLRILTIIGFPTATFPGILDESTRAICLDKTEATRLLVKIRRQWFAKRKSIMAILKEVMTNESSALLDSDAHNKALDADAALQELGSDAVSSAYVTATVTVWDQAPRPPTRSCGCQRGRSLAREPSRPCLR
jgi:hypothetical protein